MISSYAKSKKAKRVETESKMVATRGWGGGGIRQMLFKDTNLQQVVNKPQRSNAQYNEYRQQYCNYIVG